MQWLLVGLGNPDVEFEGTRHNVGREFVESLRDKLPRGVKTAELNVYMNHSGAAVKKLVSSKEAARRLIVVHDELDLPLGVIKISVGSGAGGHNGVKSIEQALKTREYVRIRVGISGATPGGKLKRPAADKLADFVLGKFRPPEKEKLKKSKKLVAEAVELIVSEGPQFAQTKLNAR